MLNQSRREAAHLNKAVNRSWLAFRFFNVVSFVYNGWCVNGQLPWFANPVTSNVRRRRSFRDVQPIQFIIDWGFDGEPKRSV